jgi:hypothetical protein
MLTQEWDAKIKAIQSESSEKLAADAKKLFENAEISQKIILELQQEKKML